MSFFVTDVLSQDLEPRLQNSGPNESGTLMVYLHGFTSSGKEERIRQIREILRATVPDADILIPRYNSNPLSNEDPHLLASHIETLIQTMFDRQNFSNVILVGHSAGALLVRKAFLYGIGSTLDRPGTGGASSAVNPWTKQVIKIVLLGGLNRGWSLSPKPELMNTFVWIFFCVLNFFSRLLRTSQFMRAIERGAPFVANLRLQWLQAISDGSMGKTHVFQLLGDRDDMVSSADNKDVLASPNFTYIVMPGADHTTVAKFGKSKGDERRIELLKSVLKEDPEDLMKRYEGDSERLRKIQRVAVRRELAEVSALGHKHVVFVMHGIRDSGGWTQNIRQAIEQADKHIEVRTPSYGYFPMIRFLLFFDRQKHVRWFMDKYTETLARYPNCKVSFIGHSNGTYIAASALRVYQPLRLNRVHFAGSVVQRDYPWDRIVYDEKRVEIFRNDVAKDDVVVAIFPTVFEVISNLFGWKFWNFGDLGSAGYNGFLDDAGNANAVKYFIGGHGAALRPDNLESTVKFVLTGVIEDPPGLSSIREDDLCSWLSKYAPITVFLMGLILYLLGSGIAWFFGTWLLAIYVVVILLAMFLA